MFIDAQAAATSATLNADEVIARLRGPLAAIPGAPTFLQPCRTCASAAGRATRSTSTRCRASDVDELGDAGRQACSAKLRSMPQLVDVSSDQQDRGLRGDAGDRPRHRVAPRHLGRSSSTTRSTTPSASARSPITYTPLNQYHVVMEVAPRFWQRPETLRDIYVRSRRRRAGAAQRLHPLRAAADDARGEPPGPVPRRDASPSTSRRASRSATRSRRSRRRRGSSGLPPSIHGSFQGTAQAFQASLTSEPLLILAALVTVYIVLGILYESYIHPITILSTLPSAGVGALAGAAAVRHRAQRDRADRHHPADRHRQEERDHDDRLRARGGARATASRRRRRSTRPACCASGRS